MKYSRCAPCQSHIIMAGSERKLPGLHKGCPAHNLFFGGSPIFFKPSNLCDMLGNGFFLDICHNSMIQSGNLEPLSKVDLKLKRNQPGSVGMVRLFGGYMFYRFGKILLLFTFGSLLLGLTPLPKPAEYFSCESGYYRASTTPCNPWGTCPCGLAPSFTAERD